MKLYRIDPSVESDLYGGVSVEQYPWFKAYHLSEWLSFIDETQKVERRVYAIADRDTVVGYLPGFLIHKGPVRIFASPFEGWNTPYMGPLLCENVHQQCLAEAIWRVFREERYHYAQLAYLEMDATCFARARFEIEKGYTYVASIKECPEGILGDFSKSTRKHVRRAINRGLRVENTTDKDFIECYYTQLEQVFAKSRMRPTYAKRKVEILWEKLMPSGNLIATQVKCEDKVIATRLDFIAGVWMHSFGSASDQEYLDMNPNELARYHVMCVAAERGVRYYDMTGGGTYKAKFGAEQTEIPTAIYDPNHLLGIKRLMKSIVVRSFHITRPRWRRPSM